VPAGVAGLWGGAPRDPWMVATLLLPGCNADFGTQAAFMSLHGVVRISSPVSLKIHEPVWGRAREAPSCSAPQRAAAWRGAREPGTSRALACSEPVTVVREVGWCPAASNTGAGLHPSRGAWVGCPAVPARDPSQAWTSLDIPSLGGDGCFCRAY